MSSIAARKRRRQNWHGKQKNQKKGTGKRTYTTLDGGVFQQQPAQARRNIFLANKYKVVKVYKKLVQEREDAKEFLRTPRRRGRMLVEELEPLPERIRQAKLIVKRNIQQECKRLFPDTVKTCQVWKWNDQCDREKWEAIPESDLVRWTEISATWREKVGLKKKGREIARSTLPLELQIELDKLISEHSNGASEISERKQVVTTQDIESQMVLDE